MHHYMPEIFYHDRKGLLSVDIHPISKDGHYKIVTASVQQEVRIWDFVYETINTSVPPIIVNFVANLEGHNAAVNQVKFCQHPDNNLLASGDVHGRIALWQLSDQPCTVPPMEDFPPNKENWVRIKVFNHESDVTAMTWSPCGTFLASVSNDDSLQVHDVSTGKRKFILSYLRHFPNGIAYDPLGKYIMVMSTDRKMDLVCAQKGTRLRSFGSCELPGIKLGDLDIEPRSYKLFHDDQCTTFTRNCAFSPCGQLVIAPVGRLEIGANDIYCTYVFRRWELEKDNPAAILPCPRPTFCVRFCPLIFKLITESDENFSGLPYRVIWLALTRESIIFYDSQHSHAIALVENVTYNYFTDASWSRDGKNVVLSSLEGYCHYLNFDLSKLGEPLEKLLQCPESPHFVKMKNKKEKRQRVENIEELPSQNTSTCTTPIVNKQQTVLTPKSSGSMLKFLKKSNDSPLSRQSNVNIDHEPKSKKRITFISHE